VFVYVNAVWLVTNSLTLFIQSEPLGCRDAQD
jgi:hypothetical protein